MHVSVRPTEIQQSKNIVFSGKGVPCGKLALLGYIYSVHMILQWKFISKCFLLYKNYDIDISMYAYLLTMDLVITDIHIRFIEVN